MPKTEEQKKKNETNLGLSDWTNTQRGHKDGSMKENIDLYLLILSLSIDTFQLHVSETWVR